MVMASLLLAMFTAWVDRRVVARLEGRRRPRNGIIGSIARTVGDMARVRAPRFWPTFVAAISLLPAMMLTTLLLHGILAQATGADPETAMADSLLWWLALLLAASVAGRWVSTCFEDGTDVWSRRRLLSTVTPWLGLWIVLFVTLFAVALAPEGGHPVAAVTLVAVAGLWRRVEGAGTQSFLSSRAGAPADVLARLSSHLSVTALLLVAFAVSGLITPLSSLPSASLAAALLLAIGAGVFFSRVSAHILFHDPTPRRLRRFAWGGLLPLAGIDVLIAALQVADQVAK